MEKREAIANLLFSTEFDDQVVYTLSLPGSRLHSRRPFHHSFLWAYPSLPSNTQGAPKGIGLSSWRFNIGAGSAEQGDASDIKVIPCFPWV